MGILKRLKKPDNQKALLDILEGCINSEPHWDGEDEVMVDVFDSDQAVKAVTNFIESLKVIKRDSIVHGAVGMVCPKDQSLCQSQNLCFQAGCLKKLK